MNPGPYVEGPHSPSGNRLTHIFSGHVTLDGSGGATVVVPTADAFTSATSYDVVASCVGAGEIITNPTKGASSFTLASNNGSSAAVVNFIAIGY